MSYILLGLVQDSFSESSFQSDLCWHFPPMDPHLWDVNNSTTSAFSETSLQLCFTFSFPASSCTCKETNFRSKSGASVRSCRFPSKTMNQVLAMLGSSCFFQLMLSFLKSQHQIRRSSNFWARQWWSSSRSSSSDWISVKPIRLQECTDEQ